MNKRIRAFAHAFNGIAIGFRREAHLKIHAVIAILVAAAGFYFNITKTEWLVVLLCIALVVAAELLNSAIEHLANRVTREFDPEIGIVKDLAAGAVLIAALFSAICGLIVFIPYLI
jgi:diacylglycerol kinase (ATP)